MSIFSDVAARMATADVVGPAPGTVDMQEVYDLAVSSGKKDEAGAILRLREFLAMALHEIRYSPESFADDFPRVGRSDHVPGRERSFWRNKEAYNRWRQKVNKLIEHATGAVALTAALRARRDIWSELLTLLKSLTRDGGPIHSGEYGAIAVLADRARQHGMQPGCLVRSGIEELLEAAPSARIRDKLIRALGTLKRYCYIRSVAAFLPGSIDIEQARRRFENVLPDRIEQDLAQLVEVAAYDKTSFDETTGKYTSRRAQTTLDAYSSALRSYAWSAERAGVVDLDEVTEIASLFEKDVFYAVIRHWTATSDDPDGLCARSAFAYAGSIGVVLSRNDIEMSHIARSRKTNEFLKEGKEASQTMSPKVRKFCEPVVTEKSVRRKFLTQHISYRAQAEDLLATDKVLSGERLGRVRALGTCAAVTAIEIAGSPYRILNTLQTRHRGPDANVQLPNKNASHFLFTISAAEMKIKKQMQPVKLRRNALQGQQTLQWYLDTIRPLFPYGNPLWCNSKEDEIDPRVIFGVPKHGMLQRESIHLFVAPNSAAHLSKSVFYNWILDASDGIGMPMTPQNFRHGLASILMSRSLANAGRVAVLLNNKPSTVLRYYAWINSRALIEETQDEILAEVA